MQDHRTVILSGTGRYSDPWHPFEETSTAIAGLLEGWGLQVAVYPSDTDGLDLSEVDLLVVNAGGGSTTDDDDRLPEPARLRADVTAFTARGGATLVVHTGSNTFYETSRWAELIGGRWVPGISMHPPLGEAVIQVVDDAHPITAGLGQLHVRDELYCHLEMAATARTLIAHEHEGRRHPLVWVHVHDGVRVVYNALGHDGQAYAGADRRALLHREVQWLLRG